MDFFQHKDQDLLMWIRVQPKASTNGFADVLDDALKIRITAPPVDGKANAHLIGWLAKQFGVSKSAVTIEAGATARRKRVRIACPRSLPDSLLAMGVDLPPFR